MTALLVIGLTSGLAALILALVMWRDHRRAKRDERLPRFLTNHRRRP